MDADVYSRVSGLAGCSSDFYHFVDRFGFATDGSGSNSPEGGGLAVAPNCICELLVQRATHLDSCCNLR